MFFVFSVENRVKRNRALFAIHELRSLAHIVDMHQLTKDPERAVAGWISTESSPQVTLSVFELKRYFDYCSEMLSLISKIAALYVQDFPDPIAIQAVDEVETENNCDVVRVLITALNRSGVGQGMVEFEVGELDVAGSRFVITTDANGRAAWDNSPGKARTWFVAPLENGQRAGPLVTWQSDDEDVCDVSSAIQIYKITWRRLF